MFQTKSFSDKSFSAKSWRFIGGLITLYNVARIYIMTRMGRSVKKIGKQTVVVERVQ